MRKSIKPPMLILVSLILTYGGFAAIFITASMLRGEKFLGITLVIVLPASLFFMLLLISKISVSIRIVISLSMSIVSGAFLIAIEDYGFEVRETGVFLANLLLAWGYWGNLLLACLAIYFIFASIFYALQINKGGFVTSLISFFILTVSVGVSVGLQFTKLDFYWRLPRYNAVIRLIKNGDILPNSYGSFQAPPEYGDIAIDLLKYTDEQYFYIRTSYYIENYIYSETNKTPEGFKCEKFAGQEYWFDCIDLDP